MTNVVNFEMGF